MKQQKWKQKWKNFVIAHKLYVYVCKKVQSCHRKVQKLFLCTFLILKCTY